MFVLVLNGVVIFILYYGNPRKEAQLIMNAQVCKEEKLTRHNA